ncbi:SDR family NAD(P)-dependent oxidoreductase [Shewanella livingstonensis]|uniref:SDR family NAD(P)-dependent oxidoreductase n=1 Tax=Shewanella livingstonensis TaxID=150120 RepID=A0A3G8LTS0_9GAMM|nr:SDR family NAD(P)-dependent oxidoreductase [Shewanella livingstonensis]AZG72200.1 SDR family NAD(P)-dependent oxidoreductase [Shewanella livingstonensis]
MNEPTSAETIIVIGASSLIAQAFIEHAIAIHHSTVDNNSAHNSAVQAGDLPLNIITVSRQPQLTLAHLTNNIVHQHFYCDYQQTSIIECISHISEVAGKVSRIIMCNGILHSQTAEAQINPKTQIQPHTHTHTQQPSLMPEKRIEDIDAHSLEQLFYANSIVPMLWLSALTPLLSQPRHKVSGEQKCVISILSARVGSISDNRLGGWYGYRASKAALNMLIKTTAVEYARRLKRVKLIAFHPGTTDTPLSKPFQANVPAGKLFTPEFVASQLYNIMENSEPDGEASYLDWQGKEISW